MPLEQRTFLSLNILENHFFVLCICTVPISSITLGYSKLSSTTQNPCSNQSVFDGAHERFQVDHSDILILKEIICFMVSQIHFWKAIPSFKPLLTSNNFFELFRLRPSLRESKQPKFKSKRVFSCYSLCTLMS